MDSVIGSLGPRLIESRQMRRVLDRFAAAVYAGLALVTPSASERGTSDPARAARCSRLMSRSTWMRLSASDGLIASRAGGFPA